MRQPSFVYNMAAPLPTKKNNTNNKNGESIYTIYFYFARFLVILLLFSVYPRSFNHRPHPLRYPMPFYSKKTKYDQFHFHFQENNGKSSYTIVRHTLSCVNIINRGERYVWTIYSHRSMLLFPYFQTRPSVLLHTRKCYFSN